MLIRYHSEQQFPPNSIIHNGLKHLNPPILEIKHYLPIKPLTYILFPVISYKSLTLICQDGKQTVFRQRNLYQRSI